MTDSIDRRRLLQLSLAAVPALMLPGTAAGAEEAAKADAGRSGAERDFDFFLGSWDVKHRRLKQRLAGNNDWEEFDGSTRCQSLLGGIANFNDSVSYRAGGVYRGMGLRAFDAKTQTWADWWLDGRNPVKIDTPGIGRFEGRVGTFFSEDLHDGKPVRVRGVFTHLGDSRMQWEQAFSPDGGATWETNWVMRYMRTG
ncbi:hypothetical protein [Lysobacter antibioticus]|uniref:DUF1579 domain-containing protein n=1 Tax=Lysobacter antibioticus TaxID=84531 RepID=A0A0S2FBR9_LYSAN|nr:hypothetical protein [Lysobacter antibioticus]ALN80970.1 hypothetical protein LA76x_2840 [Lysobacter antibioticus]